MRLRSVCALGLFVTLTACGPGGGPGDDTNPITALTVAPATATLESVNNAEVFQDFTVKATYADGTVADVTAEAGWNVETQYGRFEGPRFLTTGQVGGVATVTATLDDMQGSALVTINIRTIRTDPSAPPNAGDLFTGGTIDPARAPAIVYPPDQVVVPINLGDFDVHWQDASNNDVWEISLTSAHTDIRVYVGATFPRWFVFTAFEWTMAVSNQDSVTARVRGVSTANPGLIGEAVPRVATLSDQQIQGGMYYWASGTGGSCLGVCGIYRHDVAQVGVPAERFYTQAESGIECVACHSLSRDGTKMAVTFNGGDGAGSIVDVATRASIPTPGNWNFATYTPSADKLITALNGTFDIRDPVTGAVIGQIPTGQWATQPDFSPRGNAIAYVGQPAIPIPTYNVSFTGGNIVMQPYDSAAGTYGTPQNIVTSAGENNYYPSVSPDGNWVMFNRSAGDSYHDPDAELWVVPAGGGIPIKLDLANVQSGLTNSWIRWAPFEQTVNGERAFWITFSSLRQFGNRLGPGLRPQIWMAAFFPDRASAGTDPTGPAFWLPFQNLETNNHIAQWTEQVIPIE